MKKINFNGMTKEQRLATVKSLHTNGDIKIGAFTKLEWSSEREVRKSYLKEHPNTKVVKVSEGIVRFGIDHKNTELYKSQEHNGEYHKPLYDSYVEGCDGFLIKTERPETEAFYKMVVYTTNTATKTKSKWYLNGVEVDKSELEGILTAKGMGINSKPTPMFTINLNNLISIGTAE